MTLLTRLRLEMGLTRPEMLRVLNAEPWGVAIFQLPDSSVDAELIKRAEALRSQYNQWKASVAARLAHYEQQGTTELSLFETKMSTDLTELQITTLRGSGLLKAVRRGMEWYYPTQAIRELVEYNSLAITEDMRKARGPMAAAFLSWCEDHREDTEGTAEPNQLLEAGASR